MKYLTPEQVLFIHSRVIAETGGAHGLRDLGLLESAVARPQAAFGGQDLYLDIFHEAAALMDSLVNNHPFIDGNRRTGITAAGVFLRMNGLRLTVAQKELEDFSIQIASKGMSIDLMAQWMEKNSSPLQEG